jgi:hypothetical protein
VTKKPRHDKPKKERGRPSHDASYKDIFSNPEVVVDLLNGFVHEDWVLDINPATLERVHASHVSRSLQRRMGDLVWKIDLKEKPVYVCILLEFQSQSDPWMALRIMNYAGMLYEDLAKSAKNPPLAPGELPAIFPVVFYRGEGPWNARRNVSELIQVVPAGLQAYCPRFQYFLVNVRSFHSSDLPPANTVADIIRIEHGPDQTVFVEILDGLDERLSDPCHIPLRLALTVWIQRVVLPSLAPGVRFPAVRDFKEVKPMLGKDIIPWTERWKQEGIQAGIQLGMQEGFEKGIEKGIEKGMAAHARSQLRRLLSRRFGPLPGWTEDRLDAANIEQLEEWADRILDAQTMDDVFQTQ